MENKEIKEPIIQLISHDVVERMKHTDGYLYDRNHWLDGTINGCVEWYNEGCVGISDELVDDELSTELEKEYYKIKKNELKK